MYFSYHIKQNNGNVYDGWKRIVMLLEIIVMNLKINTFCKKINENKPRATLKFYNI